MYNVFVIPIGMGQLYCYYMHFERNASQQCLASSVGHRSTDTLPHGYGVCVCARASVSPLKVKLAWAKMQNTNSAEQTSSMECHSFAVVVCVAEIVCRARAHTQ